ncbi:MAG: DUF1648 domain-containing protein [Deltaproteobacteria bacterium]|nr:DUF1648 domain-containing protein [Deltaproteobacteria bacterium]
MRLSRWDGVAVLSLVCSAMMTVAVYDRLPDPIATHFDFHGQPNGWMPRAMGAWFAPVFGLALWLFVRFVPKVLPASEKKRLPDGQLALVSSLTALFLVAVHALVLYVALVPGASLMRPVWLLLGAFFVALGLVLPRVKRNAFVGIRTAWTLTSDENWARSNRVGGYSMVVGGIGAALAGILGGATGGVVAIAFLLGSALVPAVYSLVLARRGDQG